MKLSDLWHQKTFRFIGGNDPILTLCETKDHLPLFRFSEYRFEAEDKWYDELRYVCPVCEYRTLEIRFYDDFMMDSQCFKFTDVKEMPQMCSICAIDALNQLKPNNYHVFNAVYQIHQMWAEAKRKGLYHE
jgi:hypothetical protein